MTQGADHVLVDHTWVWRADHGIEGFTEGVNGDTERWRTNRGRVGVVVNGDDVTATGLFVEHFQQHNLIWNGERGRVVLFQNELPYDPPTQADWTMPDGTTVEFVAVERYVSLKIAHDPGQFWALLTAVLVIGGLMTSLFVPRRRSEFLVSVALGLVRSWGTAGTPVIVDLCCGTGALGLAVAAGTGSGELHAADLDPAAVACARRNVEPAGGRVYQGDLFAALPPGLRGRIGVLICNAPYVPTTEIAFMPAEAREHEAKLALDGGADGLATLRRVTASAGEWLAPGGMLLVETSERQAPSMAAAMSAAGLAPRVREDDDSGTTVVTGTGPVRHGG